MRASCLCLLVNFLFANLYAQTSVTYDYHLLIGTYSGKEDPNGIHVYRFNSENGHFEIAQPVTELSNASYLAVSDDQKNVYAVSEGREGSINAFSFNADSGVLSFMNSVPAAGPCYVSVDHHKSAVFAGNYGGGSVLSIPLNQDGSFADDKVQTIQHEGSSVAQGRQDRPHVHAAVLSGDDRYLMVPDLGTDKVYQYGIGENPQGILSPANTPYFEVAPGGGPRHLTLHPNGKYAYLVLELTASVAALDYKKGKLELKQTISMTEKDFKGRVSGADIHVSPDGKFLYASNRGDANQIAIYSIDNQGSLSSVGRQFVLGKTPRNFVIDPTGNYLLVANQNSSQIVIFKRDQNTGLLTPSGSSIEVLKPVCLKFTAIP